MRDPIDRYIEDVIVAADLAREDERAVSAELKEHLLSLAANSKKSNPKEIYAMIENEFGNANKIGRSIAAAKGRFRTYLKKQRRRLLPKIAVALVLAFAVRCAVAEPFLAAGDGASPQIPRGSRVMVYKLTRTFVPGDVIVFKTAEVENLLGVVKESTGESLIVQRNHGVLPDVTVPLSRVVGRVFLNTR